MPQAPRPLEPDLSARHRFGAELRAARLQQGLSQAELAKQIHVHPDLIAKVEKAARWPTEDLVAACDSALGSMGRLAELWPSVATERRIVRQLPHGDGLLEDHALEALEPINAVALHLRRLRMAAGLSQRDLALQIGFHESGVQNIERGERAPSAKYLENTIKVLRLSSTVAAELWLLYRRTPGTAVSSRIDADEVRCPYRGLFSFREEDAPLYHGRENAVRRIVRKLEASPLVAVVGASGSGKSSVAFAGVVPSLRRSAVWDVVSLRPGSNPRRALADALHMSTPDRTLRSDVVQAVEERTRRLQRRLLIIIDQFEELYTHGCDEPTIAEFLEVLVTVARNAFPKPVKILLTFRGDFYGRLIGYRDFSDVMQDHVVHLPPMSRSELSCAIAAPASAVGLSLEDGLADRILDDAGTEAGNLPLLEFSLTRLWEQQSGGSLTFAAYEKVGRITGAITARAEEVYDSLSTEQQYAMRQLFVRLVQIARPEEDGNDARRRTPMAELSALPGVDAVIQALATARLVVTDGDTESVPTVELAHEAIIRSWHRLRGWLMEDRQFLLWQQRTRQWMQEWLHAPDPDAALMRGGILDEAQRWLTQKGRESIAPDLLEYLDASISEERADNQRQALARIDQLLTVLPRDVAELALTFTTAEEELRVALTQRLEASHQRQRWRLRIALLAHDPSQARQLIDELRMLWPDELIAVRDAIRDHHDWLEAELWREAASGDSSFILAVAVLLADIEQDDDRWRDIAPAVAASLVAQNQLHLRTYVDALHPIRFHLLEPLFDMYADGTELRAAARETTAVILLDLGADQPELLARVVAEALPHNVEQIFALLSEIVTPDAVDALKSIAHRQPEENATEEERVRLGQRRAAALCALLRLQVPLDLDRVLRLGPDPELATQFTFYARQRGVGLPDLITRLADARDADAQYTLLLALGDYAGKPDMSRFTDRVAAEACKYIDSANAGVRAAARWLKRRWGIKCDKVSRAAYDPTGRRNWFTVETDGDPLTFVVFRPGRFLMGSPDSEAARSDYESPQQDTTIARSFALCDREVTRSEFELFMAATGTTGLPNIDEWSPLGCEPVVAATWEEATAYAHWYGAHRISVAASRGVQGRRGGSEPAEQRDLRLPAEAEWEYACRSGSITAYSFGSDRSLLQEYGWFADNSGLMTHEAGILRPNPAGLFNIHGQCWEWCLDWYGPYSHEPVLDSQGAVDGDRKVLRGGCWNLGARYARSACRNAHIPANRNYYISFRLAVTLPEIDQTWTATDPQPLFWTG